MSIINRSMAGFFFVLYMSLAVVAKTAPIGLDARPRILVSTDIGGTDPDDFQSMIHLLMYADQFQIEGLISTAFVGGGKQHLLKMIELYKEDYPLLVQHSSQFPTAPQLRAVCKQGALGAAPFKGFSSSTEGSDWMVKCARRKSSQPLWVLVWGGLEDVAQALHDAPDIEQKIRVYWIGGPNKKWGINAYAYLVQHHPNLWMIEANATYRGWFMDATSLPDLKASAFFENHIRGRGALGKDFVNYYGGSLKMGDTPSLAYLLKGDPNHPEGPSWGGSFEKIQTSSRTLLNHPSSFSDTLAIYAIGEWHFKGPEQNCSPDSACFYFEVNKQQWPGYYLGNGIYAVRYSPKQAEKTSYLTHSKLPELDGLHGSYTSVGPWPGKQGPADFITGPNWYSDLADPAWMLDGQQGSKTITQFREAFLMDWAERWSWLKKINLLNQH